MKEINHELPVMPPPWCGSICRNSMSEVCVGHCAEKRDCSFFDPKKNLKLGDMPRFPETRNMTKEEKFTSVTIYLAKVVDHLQGVEVDTPEIAPPKTFRAARLNETVSRLAKSLNETTSDP